MLVSRGTHLEVSYVSNGLWLSWIVCTLTGPLQLQLCGFILVRTLFLVVRWTSSSGGHRSFVHGQRRSPLVMEIFTKIVRALE